MTVAGRRNADGLPLVTVVTPSLNQGRFIGDTIESVLGQDYPNVEYLVIDGGSTDGTLSLLRTYAGRLQWTSGADRGQAAAINAGWRRGRGAILGWLNSDDLYLPGAIRRAVSYLGEHPDAGAVYGEAHHTDERGRVLARYPTEPFDPPRLRATCFICQPTVFLRRAIVEQVGYLDESLDFCLDYDLWIRLARITRFGRLPDYLAATRLHPGTKTLGRRPEAYDETLRMLRGHFGFVHPRWFLSYAKVLARSERTGTGVVDRARFIARVLTIALRMLVRHRVRRLPS